MNDCHCLFEGTNALVPPEIYDNFATRSRIRHRQQMGYYDRCRDFELEEVAPTNATTFPKCLTDTT